MEICALDGMTIMIRKNCLHQGVYERLGGVKVMSIIVKITLIIHELRLTLGFLTPISDLPMRRQ